uniref:LRRCT domain-containing protein n=1 Tax=Knipowitschia caucasica TaxID=637954 RepID=A0AAV2JJF2_KNICA
MSGVLSDAVALAVEGPRGSRVDLQQNPWECDCGATSLKRWLEGLSAVVVMGEVVCHSPAKTKGVDLRSVSMELLCPEMEELEGTTQPEDGPSPATPTTVAERGTTTEYPSEVPGPVSPSTKDSIPLSVLVLSLLILFVSAFFAAAALMAYALKRRDKLPFRRQGEVDLAGIQMECGIFTEQSHHHHHHHHGIPETPTLPAEHSHVYDTILPPEASNRVYKEDQDPAAKQRTIQQEKASETEGAYRTTSEKDKEWSVEGATSSPISTVTGTVGALAGLHGNGILCPTVIDSQGPTPKVELVDCLFRIPNPGGYARPPPRYPHHPDSSVQDTRGEPSLVVTTASSSTGANSEHMARLRTKPDYMEVLDRSYQF